MLKLEPGDNVPIARVQASWKANTSTHVRRAIGRTCPEGTERRTRRNTDLHFLLQLVMMMLLKDIAKGQSECAHVLRKRNR
jgi:hypothetical protein